MRPGSPRCYAQHIVKPIRPSPPSEDQRIGFSIAFAPVLCGTSYVQAGASWRDRHKKPIRFAECVMAPHGVGPPDRGDGADRTSSRRSSRQREIPHSPTPIGHAPHKRDAHIGGYYAEGGGMPVEGLRGSGWGVAASEAAKRRARACSAKPGG